MEKLPYLQEILISKRANIFYLEKCRIMVKNGIVVYLTEAKNDHLYWNIPIANTTVLLLGIGTSITQAAVRSLASASVLIGFSGNGGTPLIAATEVEWLSPQSEYRPTEYLQGWMSFWFDQQKRIEIAKQFQLLRIQFIKDTWSKSKILQSNNFYIDDYSFEKAINNFIINLREVDNVQNILLLEATLTKELYKIAGKNTKIDNFARDQESRDKVNIFLNHGNYLAYGLAATVLWTLGIPYAFAVMHGKTRRGALVFDVADLVKDALILPFAFVHAKEGLTNQEFRDECISNFLQFKAIDFMFDHVKEIALTGKNL